MGAEEVGRAEVKVRRDRIAGSTRRRIVNDGGSRMGGRRVSFTGNGYPYEPKSVPARIGFYDMHNARGKRDQIPL